MTCPFSEEIEAMRKKIISLEKERDSRKEMDIINRGVTRQNMNIYCRYEDIMEALKCPNESESFDTHIRRFFKLIADEKISNKDHFVFALIAEEYDGSETE